MIDNANRLTQITQGAAIVTIGYDNANRRTSLTLPNGIVAAYGYAAASRLTSLTYTQGATTIGNLSYTYDANGRRITMGGSLAKVNLPAAVSSAIYNANNQLTNWNGTVLSYDLNGNMLSDGTNTYTWDARDQLAALGAVTFAYDAFGRRTRNAVGTSFLYDGINAVQELSGSTVTANLLTGGVDEVFARTDSAGVRNFLTDALGSTLALTDPSGAIQTQYSFEPFGKTTTTGPTSTNSFQYTGRENDGTGLYYYRARYYNPALGRFIGEDPIEFQGGNPNLYVYTSNAPTVLVDPSGLQGATAFGCAIAGPGGCAAGGFADLAILGGALLVGGAIVTHFDPKNPPSTWPDPLNLPTDWVPHPRRPDTWLDPDGDVWHYHDDPLHGPPHWDLSPGENTGWRTGSQWWWPQGGKPGRKPPVKQRPPPSPGRSGLS